MNELELILTEIFDCSRTNLYLNSQSIVFRDSDFRILDRILRERAKTIPIQYILGSTEFMGLFLKVKKDVLIPRPETEILVEAVIERIQNSKLKSKNLKILDLGTGCGCIAIALTKFLDNVDIVATDISKEALDLAKENAKLHRVEKKIRFLRSDLFNHDFFKNDIKFDIIVSNPPYVATSEIGIFDTTVANEPKIALDGGGCGLDFYRKINKEVKRFLNKGGFLFLELGYGQADNIRKIFSEKWVIEEFLKDYQGIERVCIIRKKYYNSTFTCLPGIFLGGQARGEYSNRE